MAIREIRVLGDDVLTKHCKEITKMSIRTKMLIEDMLDTMYEAMGVGLAAPQVGVSLLSSPNLRFFAST